MRPPTFRTIATSLVGALTALTMTSCATRTTVQPVSSSARITSPAQQPLNVLVLVIDDTRWDALGAAGNTTVRTPRLDQLARDGVRFTNAFVTTSICMVSRASIFTGQHMSRHGITAFGVPIAPNSVGRHLSGSPAPGRLLVGICRQIRRRRRPRPADFDFLRSYETRHWQKDEAGNDIHVTEKNARDALASCATDRATDRFR